MGGHISKHCFMEGLGCGNRSAGERGIHSKPGAEESGCRVQQALGVRSLCAMWCVWRVVVHRRRTVNYTDMECNFEIIMEGSAFMAISTDAYSAYIHICYK